MRAVDRLEIPLLVQEVTHSFCNKVSWAACLSWPAQDDIAKVIVCQRGSWRDRTSKQLAIYSPFRSLLLHYGATLSRNLGLQLIQL